MRYDVQPPSAGGAASRADAEWVAEAERAAAAAATRAGVAVRPVADMAELRRLSELFETVWGRSPEGVPIGSEVMRSLVHAGGCVTAACSPAGDLVGGAVLTPAAGDSTYSLIAAVAPDRVDGGLGHALKLAQRAWALAAGFQSMTWTFDPLVSRNARFNLVKLGADAWHYEPNFYGRLDDVMNGGDDTDRLVARWDLATAAARAAAAGQPFEPVGPDPDAESAGLGPDGQVALLQDAAGRWIRVPSDILELRRRDPGLAGQWRYWVRDVFTRAFSEGMVATHVTRQGWYLLTYGGRS